MNVNDYCDYCKQVDSNSNTCYCENACSWSSCPKRDPSNLPIMVKRTKYMDFWLVGKSKSGKTKLYDVLTGIDRGNDTLGHIYWFGRWRQYIFSPEGKTIFSNGCLKDIEDFLGEINK